VNVVKFGERLTANTEPSPKNWEGVETRRLLPKGLCLW